MSIQHIVTSVLVALAALTVTVPGHAETPTQEGQQVIESSDRLQSFVATITQPMISVKELKCLARNIFFESASEPEEGKVAVGLVTLNRVEDGRFGSTVCKVIAQPRQFSWFTQKNRAPREDDPRWVESQRIAQDLLSNDGSYSSLRVKYDDALYFHANHVRPTWAKQKKSISKIGGHKFYAERERNVSF